MRPKAYIAVLKLSKGVGHESVKRYGQSLNYITYAIQVYSTLICQTRPMGGSKVFLYTFVISYNIA